MNRLVSFCKHLVVWLCRFRHRRGYGVHSPFAFQFITCVVYERAPYYCYDELLQREKALAPQHDRQWSSESLKVKRLLFRLVNYSQPATLIDAGCMAASSLYLKAGKHNLVYWAVPALSDLFLEPDTPVDFLYLHDYRHPEFVDEVFRLCVGRTGKRSVFVVEGIGYTSRMRALWKRMQQHERVGITFDLYDLGILFFDRTMNRQSYRVNFGC